MYDHTQPEADIHLFRFGEGLTEAEAESYLSALDQLLAGERTFVMIVESDGKSPMPLAQRKAGNLLFKSHRDRIAALCRLLVRVQPGLDKSYEGEAFARAMPFPVRVADDLAMAVTMARDMIAGQIQAEEVRQ